MTCRDLDVNVDSISAILQSRISELETNLRDIYLKEGDLLRRDLLLRMQEMEDRLKHEIDNRGQMEQDISIPNDLNYTEKNTNGQFENKSAPQTARRASSWQRRTETSSYRSTASPCRVFRHAAADASHPDAGPAEHRLSRERELVFITPKQRWGRTINAKERPAVPSLPRQSAPHAELRLTPPYQAESNQLISSKVPNPESPPDPTGCWPDRLSEADSFACEATSTRNGINDPPKAGRPSASYRPLDKGDSDGEPPFADRPPEAEDDGSVAARAPPLRDPNLRRSGTGSSAPRGTDVVGIASLGWVGLACV